MVKIRGACDKSFWIYKQLNKCATTALDSDDVLVVEEEAFLCVEYGHKTVITVWRGGGEIIESLIYPILLIACTSDLHHSTQRPEHYEK